MLSQAATGQTVNISPQHANLNDYHVTLHHQHNIMIHENVKHFPCGAFPIYSRPMYTSLNIHERPTIRVITSESFWTCTLFGLTGSEYHVQYLNLRS